MFVLNLAVVVALLVATVLSGKRGRRRSHIPLAIVTVLVLILAIWQADVYGRGFTFHPVDLTIHLVVAISTLVLLPVVVYTGQRLSHGDSWRVHHRRSVVIFLGAVVLSVATACLMFLRAVPKDV